MGILIGYKDRETKFWYGCDRKQIKEVVRSHFGNWKQDANGPIRPEDAVVQFVSEWDGDEIKAAETVDHLALVK